MSRNLMDLPCEKIGPPLLSAIAGGGIEDTRRIVRYFLAAGRDAEAMRIEACGIESASALEICRIQVQDSIADD